MTVTPVAVLALNGVDVAAGPDPDGSWPGLMALDGATVKWGRTDVLAQPTPATASVSLFDPTGSWAAGQELIGQPVTLRWTVPGESHVYFRGRVAEVTVTARTLRDAAGAAHRGATVDLAASSVLVDLANRRPTDPDAYWPEEPFATRRNRIAAQCTPVVSAVTTRPVWNTAPMAQVSYPGNGKMLAYLTGLFDSLGADRFSYDPDTQELSWVGRRTFPAGDTARLVRDSSRVGVYVTGPTVQRADTDPVEPAVAIPAAVVEGTATVSKTGASRITRVTLTYPGAVSKGFTALTPGLDESVVGIRSLDVAAQHTDDTQALAAVTDLSAMVAGEASGWLVESMRWDTSRPGGQFQTLDQVRLLLAGAERNGVFWLSGSELPALGVRPLFGVMGGTITTRRGGWRVDWTPAPTSVTGTAPPVTWDDLDPTLVWSDTPTDTSLHPSVTYDDLSWVTSGALTIGA